MLTAGHAGRSQSGERVALKRGDGRGGVRGPLPRGSVRAGVA